MPGSFFQRSDRTKSSACNPDQGRVPCASGRAPGPLRPAFPPGLRPASHSTPAVPSGRRAGRIRLLVEGGRATSPATLSRSAPSRASQNPRRLECPAANALGCETPASAPSQSSPISARLSPSFPPGRQREPLEKEASGTGPEGARLVGGPNRLEASWRLRWVLEVQVWSWEPSVRLRFCRFCLRRSWCQQQPRRAYLGLVARAGGTQVTTGVPTAVLGNPSATRRGCVCWAELPDREYARACLRMIWPCVRCVEPSVTLSWPKTRLGMCGRSVTTVQALSASWKHHFGGCGLGSGDDGVSEEDLVMNCPKGGESCARGTKWTVQVVWEVV